METHQSFLFTIAQIATAFVGFSTVVRAITPDIDQFLIRQRLLMDVAVIGFTVVAGALLPYVIGQWNVSESTTWQVSSALALAASLAGFVPAAKTYGNASGVLLIIPVYGRLLSFGNAVICAVAFGMLLWNTLSPGTHSDVRYISSLVLELGIAAIAFLSSGFAPTQRLRQ